MSESSIVQPGEGRRLDLGNFEAFVLATAAQTSSEYTLLQVEGSHRTSGHHCIFTRDLSIYVLEGEYLMYVEDCQQLCPLSTFV